MIVTTYTEPIRRRAHGFSLLELLTALAIVSVLAVLGSAALSRSRQMAMGSRCASHLKMLYGGFIAFANDHNGLLPYDYYQDAKGDWRYASGFSQLKSYLPIAGGGAGYRPPYLCPVDKTPHFGFSYGVNAYLTRPDSATGVALNRMANFPQLSRTFLLADSLRDVVYANASSPFAFRHGRAMNVVFLDGHVERCPEPVTGVNARNEAFWNPMRQ